MCTLLLLLGGAGRNSVHTVARAPVVAASMCTVLLLGRTAGRNSVHMAERGSEGAASMCTLLLLGGGADRNSEHTPAHGSATRGAPARRARASRSDRPHPRHRPS